MCEDFKRFTVTAHLTAKRNTLLTDGTFLPGSCRKLPFLMQTIRGAPPSVPTASDDLRFWLHLVTDRQKSLLHCQNTFDILAYPSMLKV